MTEEQLKECAVLSMLANTLGDIQGVNIFSVSDAAKACAVLGITAEPELLKQATELESAINKKINELSGGQQVSAILREGQVYIYLGDVKNPDSTYAYSYGDKHPMVWNKNATLFAINVGEPDNRAYNYLQHSYDLTTKFEGYTNR